MRCRTCRSAWLPEAGCHPGPPRSRSESNASMTTQPASSRPASPESSFVCSEEPPLTGRRAAAAIGVGLFLIVLTAVAIRYIEMVTGQYLSNGVPPLPAFAAVLGLSLLRPVLRRRAPRLAPTRAQILLIY